MKQDRRNQEDARECRSDSVCEPMIENHLTPCKDKELDSTFDEELEKAIGVDEGWAWLVMVAVFLIFFIQDGLSCSFGVLYVELLDYFQAGKGETAMIGALLYGIPLLVTPFCCGCIEIAGYRNVTIVGGIVTTLVFFFCMFANSILFLTIAIGVIAATTMAMSFDAGILCLTHYFDKRRGLATGIAMASTGIGTFVFAPFLEFLIRTYAWRGCLLILSGLCMNVIACGAVFRPLRYAKTATVGEAIKDDDDNVSMTELELQQGDCDTRIPLQKNVNDISHSKKEVIPVSSFGSKSSMINLTALGSISQASDSNKKEWQSTSTVFMTMAREFLRVFKLCFQMKLFRNPKWILFVLSNLLYCTSFGFGYIYIPHFAVIKGVDEADAALLLSVLGIGNTISMIGCAIAADYTSNFVLLYAGTMLLSGASLIVFPFITGSYIAMCAVTFLFSMGVGANYAGCTLITVQITGLDNLNVGYGQLGFVQGIAATFGTPSGGWVYDAIGSYDAAFIGGGIVVFLSGIVLLPFPFLDRRANFKVVVIDEECKESSQDQMMVVMSNRNDKAIDGKA